MRVPKFLSIALAITSISLLYVWQQTEIFRLAYLGEKRQQVVEDLLDKNVLLRYNIEQKSSVVSIGDKVCASSEFQLPDRYRMVRVFPSPQAQPAGQELSGVQTFAAKIFGIKRQAEAQTINPE